MSPIERPIRVLLVDDEPLLLDSLKMILGTDPELEVVGTAIDGVTALQQLTQVEADLALIDLNMAGMGGLQLIVELRKRLPEMSLLVLTTFYDEKNITGAIKNGADGYILKDAGRAAIIRAIKNVCAGQSVLDSKVMSGLAEYMAHSGQQRRAEQEEQSELALLLDGLTEREKEICRMIAAGSSNSDIAAALFISEGTVKNYISSIYYKLNVRERAALAVALSKLDF